jgi:nitrite reductase/ring-hydroxylating ferredoxin subunit
MVLGRGLVGTQGTVPKVACPMHKKTFSLATGEGLSDPAYRLQTFPVEVRGAEVWVQMPPAAALPAPACRSGVEATCGATP